MMFGKVYRLKDTEGTGELIVMYLCFNGDTDEVPSEIVLHNDYSSNRIYEIYPVGTIDDWELTGGWEELDYVW